MFKFSNGYLWTKQLTKLLALFNKNEIATLSQFTSFQVATFQTICRYSGFHVTWNAIPNGSPRVHK